LFDARSDIYNVIFFSFVEWIIGFEICPSLTTESGCGNIVYYDCYWVGAFDDLKNTRARRDAVCDGARGMGPSAPYNAGGSAGMFLEELAFVFSCVLLTNPFWCR
jgi:hypothetical protein